MINRDDLIDAIAHQKATIKNGNFGFVCSQILTIEKNGIH
jgi:hypothetical protein